MKKYSEQLSDPRWQRRRLEIMQRDDFACAVCGRSDETLNVHHRYYEDGLNCWEYPDNALTTLCHQCHKAEHFKRKVKPIPQGRRTELDAERDRLMAILTGENYGEVLPRIIEIDKAQYRAGYNGFRGAG